MKILDWFYDSNLSKAIENGFKIKRRDIQGLKNLSGEKNDLQNNLFIGNHISCLGV